MSIYKALELGAYQQIEKNEGMFKYLITQFKKDCQRFPDWLIDVFTQSYKSFETNEILTNYFLSQLLVLWVQGDILYANFELSGTAYANKELSKNIVLVNSLKINYFNTDDDTFINGNAMAKKYEDLQKPQYVIKDINIACKASHIGDGNFLLNQYFGLYNNQKICATGIHKPDLFKLSDIEYQCPIEIGVTKAITTWWHLQTGLGFLLRIPYETNMATLLCNKTIAKDLLENLSEKFIEDEKNKKSEELL